VVLRWSDLCCRRDTHGAWFLAIVEKEEMEGELDRRLGSCRVVDDAGQGDAVVWES
jgi:hypothetical protein